MAKWSSSGEVELQGSYSAGKFTGEIIMRNEHGQIGAEEKFVDGARVEYAETLGVPYANGQIRGEQRWINGIRHETLWYEDGQKERFSTVGNETEDGQWMEWYENGQKKSDYKKVFGITEGPINYWYENGQKKSQGFAMHGKKHGVHTEWHEDGTKKSESNYVAGRLADAEGVVSDPLPPKNSVVAEPGTDVTYNMHTGSIRFWNTAIESVSDGTFEGNTAVVAPGAMIQMTGNWQVGPRSNSECNGCNVQIYVAWVPDAAARGAWPPNKGLWQGMAQSVKPNAEPSGTFDWTTEAPTLPGVYYVGRGQTLDFAFKRMTEGKLGALTSNPDSEAAASFMIEVQVEPTD